MSAVLPTLELDHADVTTSTAIKMSACGAAGEHTRKISIPGSVRVPRAMHAIA